MLPETTGGEAYGFRPNERHRQISSGTAQPGLALRGMLGGKSIQKLALMPGRSEVGRASALTRGEYARRRNSLRSARPGRAGQAAPALPPPVRRFDPPTGG